MSWLSQLTRLQPLESELAFVPVGRGETKKGPQFLGKKFGPEEDWTLQALTIEQILNHRHQPVHSVGARTGLHTGPLLAFDFDGETALALGLFPWDVTTWQIHRDNDPFRLKVLFRPTPEQISQLPSQADGGVEFEHSAKTKDKEGDAKGEALEVFFHGGRQVIVLGAHPSSGGNYIWPNGLGPEALSHPPQEWMDFAVQLAHQHGTTASTGSKPSTTRKGTRKLDPCPICGRHSGKGGSALWCDETTAGLILCMPGSTFSAEQSHGSLSIGQVVNGYALVKRTADFLTFKPHEERPQPLTPRQARIEHTQQLARLVASF